MPTSSLRLIFLTAVLALGGCASASHNPQDPFESFNRGVFKFNDAVDKAVAKPVAKGYKAFFPAPARMMVSNFFSNLGDVIVAANDLLQFKVVQAIGDLGRVVVNTTVGMYGLVDVATHVGLKKHNEDFGQTLGHWGIGNGPYLVLPFLGPSTVRDGIGDYADSYLGVSKNVDDVPARNQLMAGDMLDARARLLDKEELLNDAMIDRYSFIRETYLQYRLNLVYDGNPPRKKYDDEEDDNGADNAPAKDTHVSRLSVDPETSLASQYTDTPRSANAYRMWVSQENWKF